jgi:preprotein translocase subunit SecB
MTENTEQTNDERKFELKRLYTKDVSFETPNSPEVFTLDWNPENQMSLNSDVSPLGNDTFEIVLTITVTSKLGDKTAFLVEVKQAGIFTLANFPDNEMGPMLGAYCPNILFPYAREAISDLVTKGGFPTLLLAPVNFDQLFAQHMQQQQAAKEASSEETH